MGKNATLECVTDDSKDTLEWIKDRTSKIFVAGIGIANPDKYERKGTGNNYSLKIKRCEWDTDTTDAGEYTCNPFSGAPKSAQVAVMGKESCVMPEWYIISAACMTV